MDLSDRFLSLMGETLRLAQTQDGLSLSLDEVHSRLLALAENERALSIPSAIPEPEGTPGLSQFQEGDLELCRFAVYAWVDEKILSSERPDKSAWLSRSLQGRYFHTSEAGRLFYSHLGDLMDFAKPLGAEENLDLVSRFESFAPLADVSVHGDAVRVYALCLLYGFRGQYFGQKEVLNRFRAAAKKILGNRIPPRTFSPSRSPFKAVDGKDIVASLETALCIVAPALVCLLFAFFCASLLADIPLKSF